MWRAPMDSDRLKKTILENADEIVSLHARRHEKRDGLVGRYSFGHIRLYPCPKCSGGFLTFIFLHELCHAWLDQYHEQLYEIYDSCGLSDEFAETGYRILSGVGTQDLFCHQFPLSERTARARFGEFQVHAAASIGGPELRRLLEREFHGHLDG
jgi:hypothetical protein